MAEAKDRLSGVRVLVVEDEFLIADDLARALRKCGADPIGPVGTADEARKLIKKEPPDAAILDLNLHGEVATDLIEQLSSEKVPCLILSGYSVESFPGNFRETPSLEKPVAYERVTDELAKVLKQRNGQPPASRAASPI
jgi:DNA-binding NtrC family response regulator